LRSGFCDASRVGAEDEKKTLKLGGKWLISGFQSWLRSEKNIVLLLNTKRVSAYAICASGKVSAMLVDL